MPVDVGSQPMVLGGSSLPSRVGALGATSVHLWSSVKEGWFLVVSVLPSEVLLSLLWELSVASWLL